MPHQPGLIAIWSGTIASIPAGWTLCDGTAGTPDLRDRFVLGAGGAQLPDAVGGSDTHDHDFTGDGHNHTIGGGTDIQGGSGRRDTTDTIPVTGTTDLADSFPPFYALAFIMAT